MTQDIEIKVQDGVQVMRFLRAEKKNALTGPMYNAMSEALDASENNDAIACHVFIVSGGFFCAGNDIKTSCAAPQAMPTAARASRRRRSISSAVCPRRPSRRPRRSTVSPSASAPPCCCMRPAVRLPTASLRTPFLDLGLIQEAGSTITAPERMGYPRAFELICLGEPFSAERALQAGLINAIVPADQLETTALKAARRLVAEAPAGAHDLAPAAAQEP